MDNNLKLRKAIIIAIALMGTGYSMHSKAIGLGDVLVKSYIGQPLVADIKVNGINKKTDASCFDISSDDANAISHVNFKLNRLSDEEGVLSITTNRAVLEPIASLTVVSYCDNTFTRQYNLLIDPAPISSSTDSTALQNDFSNNTEAVNTIAPITTSGAKSSNSSSDTLIKSNTKAKSKAKRAASQTVADVKSATNSKVTTNTAPTSAAADKVKKPVLTISGGNIFANQFEPTSLKLNFDKSIKTDRTLNPAAYSEEAAFSDEVTVMNNRLAHLDKQLNSIRQQNIELKNTNAQMHTQITDMKQENDFLRVMSFFFGGGLLASSYFFMDWLRRRNETLKAEKEKALWESLEGDFNENDPVEVQKFNIDDNYVPLKHDHHHFEVKSEEDFDEFEKSHIFTPAFTRSADEDFVEEVTTVADDAKLFLSHGRTGLAIQLLQNHLIEFPRESASNWLFLLDLLAKEGKQEEFETAANECKKYFNVELPKFSHQSEQTGGIESFERISLDLQRVWGTSEATSYLDDLIHNARNQPREGLNKELFEELVLLREIAEEEIKLAEVIPLTNKKANTKAKKEQAMPHQFPEIEVSNEFKELGKNLALENTKKDEPIPSDEHFEFELLDIAHR
ncbi:MAG: type IV pilus assembly protein FimV [Methylophilus sp.]